jgi:hypothetical protein
VHRHQRLQRLQGDVVLQVLPTTQHLFRFARVRACVRVRACACVSIRACVYVWR